MATVYVGSARSDENGNAHSGKAGDQKNGKEVSTQAYYVHSKGWRVLRLNDPAKAERAAKAMQMACDSPLIGYDQWQRDTLYNAVQNVGFDIAKLNKAVETDCSALVRVCLAYAFGYDIVTGSERFSTANMCSRLINTGLLTELKGDNYTKSSAYLKRGDILCTKTQGHVVMVLNDGAKSEKQEVPAKDDDYTLKEFVRDVQAATGATVDGVAGPETIGKTVTLSASINRKHAAVKPVQRRLAALGYDDVGKADGIAGPKFTKAVKAYQTANGCVSDGEITKRAKTWRKLLGME